MSSRHDPLPILLTRRSLGVGSAASVSTALVLGSEAQAAPRRRRRRASSAEGGQAVLDWQRVSFVTVYGSPLGLPPLTPIPVGVPVLGFVSMAMYRAASSSAYLGSSSESAAVARAAHDVLLAYYPAQADALAAALATTFDAIGPGHERTKGSRIGADAARDMLESREGDGYLDGSIHYSKPATAPYWQPAAPATDMLAAWLGSLRPLVVAPEPLSGPYSLGSSAWADDYEEVRLLGSAGSTARTALQTATALFYNTSNSAIAVGDAVVRYLETHPMGILETARLFARMHAAATDSVICCWKEKRDVGFWRPFQAISGQHDDGNARTSPEPGWTPLAPNPPYSDYISGHGALTAPQVEVVRRTLGEATGLEITGTMGSRAYSNLSEVEHEAFHARIWGGLHYRKAMTDAYEMGHRTARRVMDAVG
jgi:hypothetical protein